MAALDTAAAPLWSCVALASWLKHRSDAPQFCQQRFSGAVYPANVRLINLWSWPKIEAIQLSAGLWQGYNTKGSTGSRKPSPFLPFLPRLCFHQRREGTVFLFPLLREPCGTRMDFIKAVKTVGRQKKKKPFRIKQTFLKLNNVQADSESLPWPKHSFLYRNTSTWISNFVAQ